MLTAAANLTARPPGDDADSSFRMIHAEIETARVSAATVTATITARLGH